MIIDLVKSFVPDLLKIVVNHVFPDESQQRKKAGGRRFNCVDANKGAIENGGNVGSTYDSSIKPVGPAPSADPRSPNYKYDYMVNDFFGGNFFSQMLAHSEPLDLIETLQHLTQMDTE